MKIRIKVDNALKISSLGANLVGNLSINLSHIIAAAMSSVNSYGIILGIYFLVSSCLSP